MLPTKVGEPVGYILPRATGEIVGEFQRPPREVRGPRDGQIVAVAGDFHRLDELRLHQRAGNSWQSEQHSGEIRDISITHWLSGVGIERARGGGIVSVFHPLVDTGAANDPRRGEKEWNRVVSRQR